MTAGPRGVLATEPVAIGSLKAFRGNARIHDIPLIKESLEAHGQYRAIVARKKTREVLAGNGTFRAARELGWDEVLVHWVDVTAEEAKRIVAVDNRASDVATYDEEALVALLGSLPSLDGTGWTQDGFDALRSQLTAPIEQPDGAGSGSGPTKPRVTCPSCGHRFKLEDE